MNLKLKQNKFLIFISLIIFLSGCSSEIINPVNTGPRIPLGENAHLIITEVGSNYNTRLPIWFEIYNPSTNIVANLSDYSFRAIGRRIVSSTTFQKRDSLEFVLPNQLLEPKNYAVVRGNINNYQIRNSPNSSVVYVNQAQGYFPFFKYNEGYIELIYNRTNVIDYVKFGSQNNFEPSDRAEWSGGEAISFPKSPEGYGYSIARKYDVDRLAYEDNNLAADWHLATYATRGGPNDIGTNWIDRDHDGIPDQAEAAGSSFGGLPLYEWGARPGQRDIFIEIDYMAQGSGEFSQSVTLPVEISLQKIRDVFAGRGIQVHFDVGDLFDEDPSSLNPSRMDLGNQQNEVPFYPGIDFFATTSANQINYFELKNEYMDLNRRQIFFYIIIANSLEKDGSNGSLGQAELRGNDTIISLGSYGKKSKSFLNELSVTNDIYINLLSSTIMHELGHNLGLLHGGDVRANYKPNYISTMNYLYSVNGLPNVGNQSTNYLCSAVPSFGSLLFREGDRYYLTNYKNKTCFAEVKINSRCQLFNSPLSPPRFFKIDFSDGSGSSFNEFGPINETLGLGRPNSTAVDFNCDGKLESELFNFNLNPDYDDIISRDLSDYNDWGNIDIVFRRRSAGDTGPNLSSNPDPLLFNFDPILQDDEQEISVESKEAHKKMMESILNY